jgi:pullulanase
MVNWEERKFEAYLDELDLITILLPKHLPWESSPSFTLIDRDGETEELKISSFEEHEPFYKYLCKSHSFLVPGGSYFVKLGDSQTDLQIGAVIRTAKFDELYAYDGHDLGNTYTQSATFFKLWAPSSTCVKVKLNNPNDTNTFECEMIRSGKGTWELTLDGDWEGYFYSFLVCVNSRWREAVDPYAKSVSVNGRYGVIIDGNKVLKMERTVPKLVQPTDAIIYETHIRDFSIHPESLVNQKGKYKGFAEKTSETGLDYLVNLGITHVELLPVNDFAGVDEERPEEAYNWGYNPLHFFAPEGSYCTNPGEPYKRVIELQEMIQEIHSRGLKVILDVVFNHVYIKEESPFEKIVPGYYFRYDVNGMPSNGTGVGNDIASERRMVRKFIIDCVLYWIKTYGINGFRFDLMGILDVETMNTIRKKVDEIDNTILLFGEGWELNTPLAIDQKATTRNTSKMPRIGHFNDRFRDLVKGSTFNLYDRGFALGQNNRSQDVKQVIAGSVSFSKEQKGMFLDPELSINYIESHDNHTFWDKAAESNSYEDEDTIRRRQRLATSVVLLSQGVPFLHSGQEFYRTKKGIGNSYQSNDTINQLDWSRKIEFEKDIQYVKGIIKIRKSHGAFRFSTSAQVRKHMSFLPTSEGIIAYKLTNVKEYGDWNHLIVVFNNNTYEQYMDLPEKSSWFVLADHQQASELSLYKLVTKKIMVGPISCFVLVQ